MAVPHGSARPDLVYALYRQATERLDAGAPRAAAEILELAVEHEPEQASLHEALGRAYFASARPGLARRQFERAAELDPSDAYAHFGIGRCFEREGHLARAVPHLKLACALADRAVYRQALQRVQARLAA